MKHEDFCVFILTHGRANNVETCKTLKRCGYTGKVYLLVDDEDDQIDEYRKNYGEQVIVFSKKEVAERCDQGDLSEDRRVILYARNRCFDEAERLGVASLWRKDFHIYKSRNSTTGNTAE